MENKQASVESKAEYPKFRVTEENYKRLIGKIVVGEYDWDHIDKIYKEYFDTIKRLRGKYKICELCDRAGKHIVVKPDKKRSGWEKYGIRYCERHMKENIELNKLVQPMMQKVLNAIYKADK